jgi:tetratricopeptide (TPR) repeat protein
MPTAAGPTAERRQSRVVRIPPHGNNTGCFIPRAAGEIAPVRETPSRHTKSRRFPMTGWQRVAATLLAAVTCLAAGVARAEGEGQSDLDEALRIKVVAGGGLRELNEVIELLEKALDKGLDVENSDFAEQVLSESLLERATQLATVVESVPEENLADPRMQRIRSLAVSDLRRVLTYDEPPAEAPVMLAKILSLPGGDRDEARKLLEELIDKAESFTALPPAEQAAALALRGALQSDVEKALADFARAIELAPDNTQYQLARAKFRVTHDDAEQALADVKKIVEERPDDLAAIVLMSQIQRELKKFDDALETLAKAAELAPHSPIPPQYRGEIYQELDQHDKAIEEFSRVLELQPGLDIALIRRSQAYLYNGDADKALADIDLVLKDNPAMALAHGLRAQALAASDRVPEAITEMRLLAEELPGQVDVQMQLALYYQLNRQTRDAIETYTKVLELEGDNFLALRSRGDAYLGIGEHAAAVADFERALKLDPEEPSLLNNFAWVLATSPDDKVRDGKRAIELATKACELTEYKRPHIISTLAAAFAEAGDIETAQDWSEKGIAVNQSDLEEAIRDDNKQRIKELTEMGEELAKELATYDSGKPIRERQTEEEDDEDKGDEDSAAPSPDGDEDVPTARPAPEESASDDDNQDDAQAASGEAPPAPADP